ncbi:MAG: translocation/assembly module TamB domain-containing protein [Bacteroidetes bacterium]|nr:translocation/assembly module TamB domain-containing protein [Bacteroidota bacterium]
MLFSLFLLAIGLVYSIRIPAVQTWIVQRVTAYLSDELKAKVTIDAIHIEFIKTLSIKGIYIEDQHKDTLLYAAEINTSIEMFAPGQQKIYLSGIILNEGIVKIQKYPNEKGLNFKFIVDYFDSGKKDSTASKPFDFNPGEIELTNMQFVYRDNRYNDYFKGVDFEDIRLLNLNATIQDFKLDEDTVFASIENISFTEKSGFEIEYFESSAKFTPVRMEFENLLIKTSESQIQGAITFIYEDFEDFDDFIHKVRINSQFEESILSSNDLTYFASELEGLDKTIEFSGKVRGTIDQLRGKNLNIAFADHSSFKGDISIAGLPDFNESFFDLVVENLETDYDEIESIPAFPFTEGENIDLPDNLRTLGSVKISGKFTGFLNDFVAYGNAQTDLGYVSSDLNLKIEEDFDKSSYSGHLSAIGFDIGTLSNNSKILGKTTFKTQVSGYGFSLAKANAKMDGNITSLFLNGYDYKNITVNGTISRKLFNGILNVNENNLGLDFKGNIDLSHKLPVFDFKAEITNAHLAKLNLIDRDSSATLNTTAEIKIQGTDIDNMTGYVNLRNTRYSEMNDSITINSIVYNSETTNNIQNASLKSDIINFDLTGTYKRTSMFGEIKELIAAYVPALQPGKTNKSDILKMNYHLSFGQTDPLFEIFMPELMISQGTRITGNIDNVLKNITLDITSDSIRYDDFLFEGTKIGISTSGQRLFVNNNMQLITVNDTLKLANFRINGNTDKNSSSFSILGSARDSNLTKFEINGQTNYLATGQVQFKFMPSDIEVNDKVWIIDDKNSALIDSGSVTIQNFSISSGDHKIDIGGIISENLNDKLTITLTNFDTRDINPLLALYDVDMGGYATGTGTFSGILNTPGINSDMFIKDLQLYGDTLGDAKIDFGFVLKEKKIIVDALVDRGGIKNIEVKGKYYINEKNDSLDFRIIMQKTNLTAFSGYAKDLISELRGKASGELRITGLANKPVMKGKIRLQQTSFRFDYLNTHYNFSEEVEFEENYFRFKNFTVNDENGNQAKIDGYVYHDHLSDFVLSFDVTAKNFQMLNTSMAQNDLYYGKAYGSGIVKVRGPLDLIDIDLALKTEKNTQIFIPLSNPEEVSSSSFINFITHDGENQLAETGEVDFSGINMNFELDVTNDAEIQLIFDSKIGDIIKGRGTGNINMSINAQGEFKMYGDYQVSNGDYLFTLQNLINKKFTINPGGTIRWSGDPYDAIIDLEGVYKLRASLYDLFQDTTFKKRVPVEVLLSLKDELFNPTIQFQIKVPDIDPTAETLINRYISTDQEKSRQTMSLLVLNRFSRAAEVEYAGTSSSGVSANATEFLSQQLSVWASQISESINVGVNYRAADAFSQEELEIAVSTQLFNDRVTLDGNVGVSDNNNTSQNTSNLVGDFNVEVKVSEDGKFRFRAFNKTINNSVLNNYNSPYTQGVGVFYREEFDTIGELIRKFRDKFRQKDEPVDAMISQ